jgi:plasmid stabilization system protein ParE
MSPFAVGFHPLAADEAEGAERWYRKRNETAAVRFRRELDRAVELISERPEASPPYVGNTQTLSAAPVPILRRLSCVQQTHPSRPLLHTRGGDRTTGVNAEMIMSINRSSQWINHAAPDPHDSKRP